MYMQHNKRGIVAYIKQSKKITQNIGILLFYLWEMGNIKCIDYLNQSIQREIPVPPTIFNQVV